MTRQRRTSISTGLALVVALTGMVIAARWAFAGPTPSDRSEAPGSSIAVLDELRMLRIELASVRAQLTSSSEAARMMAQSLDSVVRELRRQSTEDPLDMTVQLCVSNAVAATREEGIRLQGGVGHTANFGLVGEAVAAFAIDGGASVDVSITACLKDREYAFDTRNTMGLSSQRWFRETFTDTGRVGVINSLRTHLIDAVRHRGLTLETLRGNVDVFLDSPSNVEEIGEESEALMPNNTGPHVRHASLPGRLAQAPSMAVWDRLGSARVGPLPGGIPAFSLESFGRQPLCPPRVCAGIDSLIARSNIFGAADRELKNAVGTMKVAMNDMCSGMNSAFGTIRGAAIASPGATMDLGSWRVMMNVGLTPTLGPTILGVRPVVGVTANPTFATIGVGRRTIGAFSIRPFQALPPAICQPLR